MKSCPFCNGEPYCHHDADAGSPAPRPTWAVMCTSCAAQGPWSKINEADAVFRWNRRAGEIE